VPHRKHKTHNKMRSKRHRYMCLSHTLACAPSQLRRQYYHRRPLCMYTTTRLPNLQPPRGPKIVMMLLFVRNL
jgi:hypothetical protein